MGAYKETPRQKMIGMMYLVLTALLALNVSKEILNAFVLMDEGLIVTNENFQLKNDDTYNEFSKQYGINKEKTEKWYNKAMDVKAKSNDISNYITQLKGHLFNVVEGLPLDKILGKKKVGDVEIDTCLGLFFIDAKDNYDKPTALMIGPNSEDPWDEPWSAHEFKAKLLAYRDAMMAMYDEKDSSLRSTVRSAFDFGDVEENGEMVTWEYANFIHVVVAGIYANLSKVQNDIRNVEANVLGYLMNKIDATDVKVNKIEAIATYDNYILVGDTVRASIFLAAYDSSQVPEVSISMLGADSSAGEAMALPVQNGKGELVTPASSTGTYSWRGTLTIKQNGVPQPYPFNINYQVIQPSATVSATKMNVFYIGPDNPISVAASGVPPTAINVSLSGNGSVSKAKDGWNVRVKGGKTCTINVSAKMDDGSTKALGKQEFRVKPLPDPTPYFAGLSVADTKIKGSKLRSGSAIAAKLQGSDFNAPFKVVGFELTLIQGGQPKTYSTKGSALSSVMMSKLKKIKPGERVYFESIRVIGPDGKTRHIAGLTFKVL